ncbi:hypothetical protein ON010_g2980 [Phytophthora cinnamomi]|nr:hypothetical protein ON010_g2980 [Phytophthora cinnamomi]
MQALGWLTGSHQPPGAAAAPNAPLEPNPLEAAGAAPKPPGAGALDEPNENAGWAAAGAGAAGAWLDVPNENAGAAGAAEVELPNAVAGPALEELPKAPVLDPDPNPVDAPEPKAVDVEPKPDVVAGAWPNPVDPTGDEPKPDDAAAGWVDDEEPNVKPGVAAGADDVVGGVDVLAVGAVDVDAPKLNPEAEDVAGAAPNAGAVLVAGAVELWPKVKPGEDVAGADVGAVEVADAEVAAEAPNENEGALDSVFCPNPVLGFGAGVDVLEDDEPNVKPVAGGAVSFDFDSVGALELVPKLNVGAAVSFDFSVVVDAPKENDEDEIVGAAVSFAGTWGGFAVAPKEKDGVAASGLESDEPKVTAERFAGRLRGFGGCR